MSLHPGLLGRGRPDLLAGGAVQAHRRGAHVGVADERREVRAERQRLERRDVLLGGASRSCARSTASMTCWRGIASTRPNRSPASTAPTWTVDSEQEPSRIVVTPWRTDSTAPGREHLDVVVGVDVDHARAAPTCPSASTTSGQPVSSSGSAETATTWPSRMPRWRTAEGAPVPSNQRPPRMITSYVMERCKRLGPERVKGQAVAANASATTSNASCEQRRRRSTAAAGSGRRCPRCRR